MYGIHHPEYEYDNDYDSYENMLEQIKYRYKQGDQVLTMKMCSGIVDAHEIDEKGKWVPCMKQMSLAAIDIRRVVLRVYTDGTAAELLPLFPENDYMFPGEPAMLLSKSRTATLRLRVKPAKVERREEEEEEDN
jgi:hypothetical protein